MPEVQYLPEEQPKSFTFRNTIAIISNARYTAGTFAIGSQIGTIIAAIEANDDTYLRFSEIQAELRNLPILPNFLPNLPNLPKLPILPNLVKIKIP